MAPSDHDYHEDDDDDDDYEYGENEDEVPCKRSPVQQMGIAQTEIRYPRFLQLASLRIIAQTTPKLFLTWFPKVGQFFMIPFYKSQDCE